MAFIDSFAVKDLRSGVEYEILGVNQVLQNFSDSTFWRVYTFFWIIIFGQNGRKTSDLKPLLSIIESAVDSLLIDPFSILDKFYQDICWVISLEFSLIIIIIFNDNDKEGHDNWEQSIFVVMNWFWMLDKPQESHDCNHL